MPVAHLAAEFQTLALQQLKREWNHVNWMYFRERLRTPTLGLTQAETILGRWVREHRLLEFSESFLLSRPWWEVVEVLKHEVAHQFVDEVLGGEPDPHGPKFRSICANLGIDARATGLPARDGGEEPKVLDRIRRLLTLATSDNAHEAEAAMKAARKLMLEHNLAEVEARTARGYVHGHVGRPTGRRPFWQRVLCHLLTTDFFVEGVYVPTYDVETGATGTVFEILGTDINVKMASYVYAFLEQTGEQLYLDWKRRTGAKGDKAKRDYLAGVMRGFADKLRAERESQTGTGLVWKGDPGLDDFKAARHPRLRSSKGTAASVGESFAQGREDGKKIVLNRPVEAGGSGAKEARRLGSGS